MTKPCDVEGCEKPAPQQRYCSMHYARKRRNGDVHAVKMIWGDRLAAFMQKVDKTGECWEWTGHRNPVNGYGMFNWKNATGERKPSTSHRVAWELLVGQIPEGKHVDHVCHNRGCVNPKHLRLVTPRQNNQNHSGARIDSTTGVRGVTKTRNGTFATHVQHNYQHYSAGTFKTLEEAESAVIGLRNKLFTHNDIDRKPQERNAA